MAKTKTNRLRVIGGRWRSRVLIFPDVVGLRPTPDRVRETLFNWLGQTLEGLCCLDLFAGSGALGVEASSRGARRVLFVERDRGAVRALRDTLGQLGAQGCQVVEGDAFRYLQGESEAFDVVFVDPPYALACLSEVLQYLPEKLKPGGKVYVETDTPQIFDAPWSIWKQGRAGAVHYYVLERV